jgi:WD domain, G-beta repeat
MTLLPGRAHCHRVFRRHARLWDAASGEMRRELKGHFFFVWSATFSADGARIVTASWDRTARVWDAASGEMLRELKGHGVPVETAAFSPTGPASSPRLGTTPRGCGTPPAARRCANSRATAAGSAPRALDSTHDARQHSAGGCLARR